MNRTLFFLAAILVSGGCVMPAPRKPAPGEIEARVFAMNFYSWYHRDRDSTKSLGDVLRERATDLSGELRDLLKADQECAAASGEVCALDFDPFLDAQDPCEWYTTGGSGARADTIVVLMVAICGGKEDSIPSARLLVLQHQAVRQIVNIEYPRRGDDLLSILRRNPKR